MENSRRDDLNKALFRTLPTEGDKRSQKRRGMLTRALNRPQSVVEELSNQFFEYETANKLIDTKTSIIQIRQLIATYPLYMECLSDLVVACICNCMQDNLTKRSALAFISEESAEYPFSEEELDVIAWSIFNNPPEVEVDIAMCVEMILDFASRSKLCRHRLLARFEVGHHSQSKQRLGNSIANALLTSDFLDLSPEEREKVNAYSATAALAIQNHDITQTPTASRMQQAALNRSVKGLVYYVKRHQLLLFTLITFIILFASVLYFDKQSTK